MSDDYFLSRWSKRKHAAKRAEAEPAPPPPPPSPENSAPVPVAATQASPVEAPLPDVETLTPESDFTPFMRQDVDESLRRKALKNLFQDPRFNVMDGLDVYIDDYSKPDPLPDGWLEKMNQVARLGEYREPEAKAEEPEADSSVDGEMAADEVAGETVTRERPADALPETSGSDTSMRENSPPPARET